MLTQNFPLSKTLNPSLSNLQSPSLSKFPNPLYQTLPSLRHLTETRKRLSIKFQSLSGSPSSSSSSRHATTNRGDIRTFAGRSKKKPGGRSPGRIEGNAEVRREAKRLARKRSRKLAENMFYKLKNPNKNYADNFSEEELQMIGLGYDRMVRFMEKDDPNLKHPYDWYKYGEFGPYAWRGVVLGEPIRGRFSDECVRMIGSVRDQEEWEKIEQFEMAQDFQKRLDVMDKSVGFQYFWVFVRHPKWRLSDLPWQQWTLVSEVALEAGNQRLDKWNLMGRLGNKARALITQCAAWMRPDIVYVKRPVYQCRFEPQNQFFQAMIPLLDPETEQDFLFELEDDDGRVELCTYFAGLCKIAKVNPKAFVDDVVKAFDKLSDEKKSKCLEFLLNNHPVPLLHPYTKEWKSKLEDMELGCDAPDEEDDHGGKGGETEIVDWIEDDGDDNDSDCDDGDGDDNDNEGEDQDVLLDAGEAVDEQLGIKGDEVSNPEEDEKYWDEEFKKALSSTAAMENLARRSIETSTRLYKNQMRTMEEKEQWETLKDGDKLRSGKAKVSVQRETLQDGDELANGKAEVSLQRETLEDGNEMAMRGRRAKVSPQEWKIIGYGPWRKKIKKSRIPPKLFLRAAVRPFTYRNLVKEIVLTRHAILEGEIGRKK